jgi:hypothetical protein
MASMPYMPDLTQLGSSLEVVTVSSFSGHLEPPVVPCNKLNKSISKYLRSRA